MNEIYVILYPMLHKLSYLNLQFNYTRLLHRANVLSFGVKKGDTKRFLCNRRS